MSMKSCLFFVLICFFLCPAPFLASSLNFWNYFDRTPYYCKEHTDLDLSKDVFTEVANKLNGVDEYNELIRLYKEKNWEKFQVKSNLFNKIYETSPLVEGVTFLAAQFKIINAKTEEDENDLEKSIRESFILYPKSLFVPVLMANLANYWLKRQQFQKALSLYESLVRNYEKHEFFCVFLYGLGESYFGLNSFELAQAKFDEVLNKCKNKIVKTGALTKKAAISFLKKDYSKADVYYRELFDNERLYIERYYKPVLFQFAEVKYQLGKYEASRHFFSEFTRLIDKSEGCYIEALARLADISLKLKEPPQKIRGKYLVVHDSSPQSDLGKYAYFRSLLIDYENISPVERKRRDQILELKIPQMPNSELKSLINLEYGLAKMNANDLTPLNFLSECLNNDKIKFIDVNSLKNHIYEKIVAIVKKEYDDALKSERKTLDVAKLNKLENILEKWLNETSYFEVVRKICSSFILNHVEKTLNDFEFERATNLLSYWKNSKCWHKSGPTLDEMNKLALTVLKIIYNEKKEEPLLTLSKKEEAFKDFFTDSYKFIWDANALKINDLERINKARKLASVDSFSKDILDYYWLTLGEIYSRNGDYKNALLSYNNVKSNDLKIQKEKGLAELFYKNKKYESAYNKMLALVMSGNKDEVLDSLYHVIINGKLWDKTHSLIPKLKKHELKEEEISPFYFLEGRAFFEEKLYSKSITAYLNALKVAPNDKTSAEAKYRIGKCYQLQRKLKEAKKIWEELALMKDSVWSELAESELKLLSL